MRRRALGEALGQWAEADGYANLRYKGFVITKVLRWVAHLHANVR